MSTNSVPGTNVPPISFPGVVSGIDYNSIITQLTKMSLAPNVALNAQIATLNNANLELVKINGLLTSVQNTLQNLSDPNLFNAYSAFSSDSSALTASGTPGVAAIPGVYTISKVQTATATTILGSATAGHSITDPIGGTPSDQPPIPLAASYASTTPTNGSGSQGQVTVDGVTINYNVNTQSLDQILTSIQTAVRASADAGFSATLVGGTVQFTSADAPISIGSAGDKGNLLDVLKLTNAQVNNTATSGSIVGTGDVGGINPALSFSTTNKAGYVTPVTGGFFTLNGTKITVSTGDNTFDIVNRINSAGAGVVATFDTTTGRISLTASKTGPQGIVLGAAGDTSNFLSAAGLTVAAGGTTTLGAQSEVDVQTAAGTQKYFSNSNTVTSAIPGITLNLQTSTATPFTVTVSQSTTQLVTALQTFVSTYNIAVKEINQATAAPVIVPPAPGSGGQSQSIGGGVLFGNTNAQELTQRLTQIVGGVLGSGNSYNSLSKLGLQLSDSFTTITATNSGEGNSSSSSSSGQPQVVQQQTLAGTDGTLQALNVDTFVAAFTSNQSAVTNLINGANGLTQVLGAYLTNVTGAPTILNSGLAANTPQISILQNYENANTDAIGQLQQRVQQITDSANLQANGLRAQFVASESMIAQLQAEQQQLAAALGFTVSSSKSGA